MKRVHLGVFITFLLLSSNVVTASPAKAQNVPPPRALIPDFPPGEPVIPSVPPVILPTPPAPPDLPVPIPSTTPPQKIPQPSSVVGILVLGAFGASSMLRRNWNKKKSANSITGDA